ncbi:DUF3048 domain-containing protein [Candidatus Saccharibacteria bacterium]|nr:DUF3048 domain-containing protein [Candidatus Saccharibacteria bacterium]
MDKTKQSAVTSEDLKRAFEGDAKSKPEEKIKAKKNSEKKFLKDKQELILIIVGVVGLLGGVAMILVALFLPKSESAALEFPTIPSKIEKEATYSALTGEPLDDATLVNAPTFCIQTPNGMDGARPQSGINEAGVVFEAIAEAGITRFAAIYQNPSAAVIGPIRSLRLYYLEWDTPFDCTIVHAGGADDAIATLRSGGYKELDENYSYMYRGTYGVRRWNNLFTTSKNLKDFSKNRAYDTSNVKGFARMTPEESEKSRVLALAKEKLNIVKAAEGNTSTTEAQVSSITMKFGGMGNYNVHYSYDANTNTYLRGYESGLSHDVYNCKAEDLGEKNPEDVCELKQLAPSVVIAIKVAERKAADNYHEVIDAVSSGEAYIFQNGTAIKGSWKKPSRQDQIVFTDADGKEVKLVPGQTFVSAIPNYGSIEY